LPYRSFSSPRQTTSFEAIHQAREFQQVNYAKYRPLLAHDNLRIWSDNIGPLRRNGANGMIVDLQQQSHPIPVVPLAHARQLPSAKRVERMSDAHKTRRWNRSICILG
jgi:hypothetical protein